MQLLNALFACSAIAFCAIVVALILSRILAWVFSPDRLRNEAYQHVERDLSDADSRLATILNQNHAAEIPDA
jgi:hypothetical protein